MRSAEILKIYFACELIGLRKNFCVDFLAGLCQNGSVPINVNLARNSFDGLGTLTPKKRDEVREPRFH